MKSKKKKTTEKENEHIKNVVLNRTPCDSVYAFSGHLGHSMLDHCSINDKQQNTHKHKRLDWIEMKWNEMKWNHVSWVWLSSILCHRVKFTVYSAILFFSAIFLFRLFLSFDSFSAIVSFCRLCTSKQLFFDR